jgi:hypothetical protein
MTWQVGDTCWTRCTWSGNQTQRTIVKVGRRWITTDHGMQYDKDTGQQRYSHTSSRMMFLRAQLDRDELMAQASRHLVALGCNVRRLSDEQLRAILAIKVDT